MKQPNLGYADVKLDFACMHPAGSACRVSLCVYYDLCVFFPNEIVLIENKEHFKELGLNPGLPVSQENALIT